LFALMPSAPDTWTRDVSIRYHVAGSVSNDGSPDTRTKYRPPVPSVSIFSVLAPEVTLTVAVRRSATGSIAPWYSPSAAVIANR
jgi:hypothetical protein